MDTNNQTVSNTPTHISNRKPVLIVALFIVLLMIALGFLFGQKMVGPNNGQNIKKTLTDEEKKIIKQELGVSPRVLSDEEKTEIKKSLASDNSKNPLSDEEKRAIKQELFSR